MIVENIFSVNELCNFKKEKPIESTSMIDMKNASTDYLQRTSGTFNNISMLFAGKFRAVEYIFDGLFDVIWFDKFHGCVNK